MSVNLLTDHDLQNSLLQKTLVYQGEKKQRDVEQKKKKNPGPGDRAQITKCTQYANEHTMSDAMKQQGTSE